MSVRSTWDYVFVTALEFRMQKEVANTDAVSKPCRRILSLRVDPHCWLHGVLLRHKAVKADDMSRPNDSNCSTLCLYYIAYSVGNFNVYFSLSGGGVYWVHSTCSCPLVLTSVYVAWLLKDKQLTGACSSSIQDR